MEVDDKVFKRRWSCVRLTDVAVLDPNPEGITKEKCLLCSYHPRCHVGTRNSR